MQIEKKIDKKTLNNFKTSLNDMLFSGWGNNKDIKNFITEDDAKKIIIAQSTGNYQILKEIAKRKYDLITNQDKKNNILVVRKSSGEIEKELINMVTKLKTKYNLKPIDFKDYTELNYAFTNAKEGSTIHDENKKLTTHFQSIGLDNLTTNGVSLQDFMNDGLVPEGGQNEKVVPKNPEIEAASISNNNKILLKLKDSDKNIFYVNVDADEKNGNLYEKHLTALKNVAKSKTHDEKVKIHDIFKKYLAYLQKGFFQMI